MTETIFTNLNMLLQGVSRRYYTHRIGTKRWWRFLYYTEPYLLGEKHVWVAEEQKWVGPVMTVTRRRWFKHRWKAKDCAFRWYCRRSGQPFQSQHTKRQAPLPAQFALRRFQKGSLDDFDEEG